MSASTVLAPLRRVHLQLKKSLSGPYVRLLRRPGPEVAALGRGMSCALIRGTCLREPMPLWASEVNCYYAPGRGRGWRPEDFRAGAWMQHLDELEGLVRYIGVPQAHARLPNDERLGPLAEALGPWRRQPLEAWRQRLGETLWLSVLRVYECAPVRVRLLPATARRELHLQVEPFRARLLRPVLDEGAWEEELRAIARLLREHLGSRPEDEVYGLGEMAAETGMDKGLIESWRARLLRKKQLVFSGPPGTGKTYVAARLGRWLTSPGGLFETVQFHPAFTYEDFVQGIRPQQRGSQVYYQLQEGLFLRFCRRARQRGDRPCVLLIDEINRAPLARVLGELLYLLEYRGQALQLAGGGEPFAIPDNVYVLGTMNTADRSIALVDQALMRRFAFAHLRPDMGVLAAHLQQNGLRPDALVALLEEINERIADENLLLGISYFMQDGARLPEVLAHIWQGEVEPYLREAFYDRPEEWARYRWCGRVEARLRHAFDPG